MAGQQFGSSNSDAACYVQSKGCRAICQIPNRRRKRRSKPFAHGTGRRGISNLLCRFKAVCAYSYAEVGFSEAKAVSQFESINKSHYDIEEVDAFFVYSTNAELRRLLNDGLFVYAQKHFVLNDPSYVFRTEDGKLELTQYALEHLDTCTLSFSWIEVPKIDHPHVPLVLMHRANASQRVSAFIPKENQATIAVSEELQRKRDEFEKQTNSYRPRQSAEDCMAAYGEIITQRGMSSPHFL